MSSGLHPPPHRWCQRPSRCRWRLCVCVPWLVAALTGRSPGFPRRRPDASTAGGQRSEAAPPLLRWRAQARALGVPWWRGLLRRRCHRITFSTRTAWLPGDRQWPCTAAPQQRWRRRPGSPPVARSGVLGLWWPTEEQILSFLFANSISHPRSEEHWLSLFLCLSLNCY